MNQSTRNTPKRRDERIIIHFDYDCFYASVFEAENPALRSLPFAVQQKQIIVTCNYAARARGLRKLQLITEAKRACPEVIIALGEDLTRFRDASKMLYKYLEAFTWNKKVERLGFDEVFMDCTDIVDFNEELLNRHDLAHSFFQLSRGDPTHGFEFDATRVSGHCYDQVRNRRDIDEGLRLRLVLGSHLASHMRHKLEEDRGYTSTVGISTNKLIAKLVGNLHKPKGQTTLMPPYDVDATDAQTVSNVTTFIDDHDIGKIPNIGFKMSHKIRNYILARPAEFDEGLIYGGSKESVTVKDVRLHPDMSPEFLEKLLGGPGAKRGIGGRAWQLINGLDDTEVKAIRKVPSQISIEDSYIRLDTLPQIMEELGMLATSLLKRMHTDLLEDDDEDGEANRRWIALPRTLRLSTRPRPPLNADGTRTRSFNRISRSAPLPTFVFDLREGVDALVEKLVKEALLPMFRRLHSEPSGWNLSLMNVAVTNMVETASDDASGGGRDIGRMFKRQEEVLKEWKVEDKDVPPDNVIDSLSPHNPAIDKTVERKLQRHVPSRATAEPSAGSEAERPSCGSEDVLLLLSQDEDHQGWIEEEDEAGDDRCHVCGGTIPVFAMAAHERFHSFSES